MEAIHPISSASSAEIDINSSPEVAAAPPSVSPRLEETVGVLILAILFIINIGNVITRYVIDYSFAFTEEISITLMVILAFIGTSIATVEGKHLRVTFFIDKLSVIWQARADMSASVATFFLFGILTWYGTIITYEEWLYEVTSPALGIQNWIYTSALPVMSAIVGARALGRVVRVLKRRGGA